MKLVWQSRGHIGWDSKCGRFQIRMRKVIVNQDGGWALHYAVLDSQAPYAEPHVYSRLFAAKEAAAMADHEDEPCHTSQDTTCPSCGLAA